MGDEMLPKRDLKQLPILYDQYYAAGQAILDKYNPCEWKKDEPGVCWAMRNRWSNSACCGGCSQLKPGVGCQTQNVCCKLWLCPEIRYFALSDENKDSPQAKAYNEMEELKKGLPRRLLESSYRRAKEVVLREWRAILSYQTSVPIAWEKQYECEMPEPLKETRDEHKGNGRIYPGDLCASEQRGGAAKAKRKGAKARS